MAVATKVSKESKKKGDLMANDAEAMEYSSEDISDEDLDDMNYAGYKNKRRRVSHVVMGECFIVSSMLHQESVFTFLSSLFSNNVDNVRTAKLFIFNST